MLKAAASEGLEAFLGGAEHAANKEAAEKAAQDQESRDIVSVSLDPCIASPLDTIPVQTLLCSGTEILIILMNIIMKLLLHGNGSLCDL